ncbi:GAF domain-containing protein [Planococcus lenghuensis]|uniref:Histidine kinase n=1 Tax=Planococcus lenghuensis TaxID=2213202 RepID=A0A1Q2KUK6_9BACL|nr:GAF domain-containing protein [Planococcus lenghuensis]AQQ51895.1 histidine kinase [Planococcus lenghuensis]
MTNPYFIGENVKTFRNFDEAADNILRMMSQFIEINTLFIAKNDERTNQIMKAVNRDDVLVDEGKASPFEETLCKVSVDAGRQVVIIPDLKQSNLTMSLNVTEELGGGSFVGIPIYYENGENYGTICGLDTHPFEFSKEHVELFETMASLLTYVLELDEAYQQIQTLSAPFVPITKGIAILPVIGVISEERAEHIILLALTKSQELSLEYLIIDLSGISQINQFVVASLLRIVKLLELVGVTPILTGFHPQTAMKAIDVGEDLQNIQTEANLERALNKIGVVLEKRKM